MSRNEKLVIRSSERKDVFSEKFANGPAHQASAPGTKSVLQHRSTNSNDSYSSFEEGILLRNSRDKYPDESKVRKKESHRIDKPDADSTSSTQAPSSYTQHSPSESSFSLGGSAVWVGDESGLDLVPKERTDASSVASYIATSTLVGSSRNRRSTDASASSSSSHAQGKEQVQRQQQSQYAYDPHRRNGVVKDTHFYNATVAYKDHQLPIKMPLATFPEEVGDVRNFLCID